MFDLITLRLISMGSFACFNLGNLFIWRLVIRERTLRNWVVATAALASGLLLLGLYGIIPDFLSLATGNALVLLGFGFIHVGTRQLLGARPGFSWHWLAAAIGVFICLLAPSITVLIVETAILYIPFILACAGLFWFSQVEPGLQVCA